MVLAAGGRHGLGEPSRKIYLEAKENLRRLDDDLWPDSARRRVLDAADREGARSDLAIRQLSLLRVAMRADLGILGHPYGQRLDEADEEFLQRAGVRLWRRPWWDGTLRGWVGARLRARPRAETD